MNIKEAYEELKTLRAYLEDPVERENLIKDSIKRSLNEIIDEKGASSIKANLEQLKEITDQPQGLLEFIDSISSKLLSKESQEKLTGKAEIVKILAGLLPESYQNQFGYKQNYLQAFELRTLIENQISNIDKICAAETIKFESGEVSCYGYFVKASSIASKVSSDTIITTENLKVLKVYAFGSFIIDCNLSDRKLGSSNLTVIAPKWNVTITNAKINLSGLDQDQYPEGREKALSGTIAGSNGEGGLAGLPGYYGGNFFGFGNVFKNEGNLELVSNGGKGGMGQNGGDGVEGQKGIDALISDVDVKSSSIPKSNKSHATSEIIEYYYKEGSVGKKGGIGGVGGLGGKGGSGGCIKICDVQKNSVMSIKSQSSPGNDGVSGDRGADGFHGLYGDKAIKIYYKKEIIPRDQNTYSLKMICKGWKESYMKQVTERFKTEKLVDISKQVGKLAESAKAPIINEQEELIAYKKFFEDFGTGFFNLDLEFPFNEVNFDGMVLSSALIGESDDGF